MPRNKDKDEKAEKGQQQSKDALNLDLSLKESFNSLKKDVSKLEFKPSLKSILKKIDGHSVEKPKILFFHDKIKKQYFKYAVPIAALALFAIGYGIFKNVNQKSSDMVAKVDSSDEFNEPGLNFSEAPNPEIKPKVRSRRHSRKKVIADRAVADSKKDSSMNKTQSLSKAVEKLKPTEKKPADAANFEDENQVEIASLDEGMSVKMRDSELTAIPIKKRGQAKNSASADPSQIAVEKKKLWAKISKGDFSPKTIIRLKALLKKSNDKAGLKKLRVLLAKEKAAKPKK